MKIKNNINISQTNNKQSDKVSKSTHQSLIETNFGDTKYSQIAFKAIVGVKNKKIDIETEKNKILKQIDTVLETNVAEIDEEDYIISMLQKSINWLESKKRRADELTKELDELANNTTLNPQQMMDCANKLWREYNQLKKIKLPKFEPPKMSPNAEKTDFALYNKFKSAIEENNFNLETIYKEHYNDLNSIKTVEELNKKYPHIKVPLRAETVIAEKVINSLTRDFYEQLDEFYQNNDKEALGNLFENKLNEILPKISQLTGISYQKLMETLGATIINEIGQKYADIVHDDKFSTIPQFRKNKPLFSENDLKILSVDYDKFVLAVIKEQYIEGKKLNNIIYEENGTKILAGTLKEPEYKFNKPFGKDKNIIDTANELLYAQRNYPYFDKQEFQSRLELYSASDIASNEVLGNKIIEFYTCDFTEEDIEPLIKFLRTLDDISDKKISEEDAIKIVEKENLKAIGTAKQNEIKNKELELKLKEEQKKATELKNIKTKFDNAVNILYMHNLNNIALTCSKYRPKSLDQNEINAANFIIGTIENLHDEKNYEIKNKSKLQTTILRYDKYNHYQKNDKENPIFKSALNYAKSETGEIDTDKAGQYILNAEIVNNYPESAKYYKNGELLTKLMDKTNEDKNRVILCLCKYDNYNDLTPQEKTILSNALGLFDIKDSTEKIIIKNIIEEYYINCDTTTILPTVDSKDSNTVTFAKSAKRQIIEKYKFPTCIEYLVGFEEAMSHYSTEKGNSGIKSTKRNNEKQKYKMEIKLSGKDDRLFSSNNDYYFDIYSETGLH